jgi:5-methylcytosine-specific restriction endonuclease McrA
VVLWYILDMQRRPNTVCAICATAIYRRPSQIVAGQVFCSLRCSGKSQQKQMRCPICETYFVGNKKACSRKCANIKRAGISYTKDNSQNKAYKGTLLKERIAKKCNGVCQRCGHTNYAILQVHHKIERHKGGTDELSNLELLCPNCHASHHHGVGLYKPK